MTKTIENFLRYVKIDTQSSEESTTTPSTMKQHDLAGLLVSELEAMGATEITYDKEHCYVYATVPASAGCENAPVLGFIAHMDTSPAVTDTNVKPRIVENYDGKDIVLNAAEDIVMKTADFPELLNYVGKDLIVTDGTTLLGADDKAGVAEIMTMAETLLMHPEKKHGKIRIGFTPDEEVGAGADHFDVKLFGADYAYTVDGGALGELEYEDAVYCALIPYYEKEEDLIQDDGEFVVLKKEIIDGEEMLCTIEDDAEYEAVGALFEQQLNAMFEDEDEEA